MDATDQVVGYRGSGRLEHRKDLCGGVPVNLTVWSVDVGDDTNHWEGFGRIPPQVGPQDDGTSTAEE